MLIRKNDQDRLNEVDLERKATYGGRLEDYFALVYFKKKFGLEPSDVGHQIAFGGNDYGLDAYYVDAKARQVVYLSVQVDRGS